MADLPRHLRACFHTGKLAMLAILVSGGIVLQILVCFHIELLIAFGSLACY